MNRMEAVGLRIFALDETHWDRSGVEEFVSLIILLAGDLVRHSIEVEKSLEKIRFLRIQA